MSVLMDGLELLGLHEETDKIELLKSYMAEVELFNPKYGLVNAEGDTFVIKHILDSLAGKAVLDKFSPETIADVGSGGGLPGIPLAIFMPHVHFTLIERSGKRCNFLRNALVTLGIKNVTVMEKDVNKVKEDFDLVTFRAFTPMEEGITKALLSLLKPTGVIATYKGKKETILTECEEIAPLVSEPEILPLKVPFLEDERHILILKQK